MDVGRQQVVAPMLVLVALQIFVDLVDQKSHGFEGGTAEIYCGRARNNI